MTYLNEQLSIKILSLTSLCLSLIFLVSTGGCSSISVKCDYDQEANFRGYKTFDWLVQPKEEITTTEEAFIHNPLLRKRLKNAIARELLEQGYLQQSVDPDFLIAYYTDIKEKVYVQSWGSGYWRGYHGRGYYGGRDVSVTQYKEGTLIIDFIDSKTKQLFWRGWAVGVVEDMGVVTKRPEEAEEKINKAVEKIFETYPPQVK
jgi:hypothetical protein